MPRSTIPMVPVANSKSDLHAHGYDPETQTMVLNFKSSADRKDYEYPGIPPEKYQEFLAAESKGKWWTMHRPIFTNFVIKTEDAPTDSEGGEAA